jgi:hypothetical protein
MKKNVGGIDRILRLVIGLVIMAVAVYYRAWWGVFGLIIFLTGAMSRCTVYKLLNDFSTYKEKKPEPAGDLEADTEKPDTADDETMIN